MKYTIIICSSSFGSVWKDTKEPNIDILWAFKGHNSKVLSFLRMMWFKHNLPFKKIWLSKSLRKPGNLNIIFDSCSNLFLLEWLKKCYPDKRFIFYYWNMISNTNLEIEKIRDLGYEIWGFDMQDAKKYNYMYNPQFFCPSWYHDLKNIGASTYDVSFVGRDKHNRMQQVTNIMAELSNETALTSNLYFTAPKWYLFFRNKNYKKILSFKEMLRTELSAKIILDIADNGQCGYTLRVFDALYNGRKLITNNINIINEDFYDKHNIFIYGIDSIEDFRIFLSTPFNTEKKLEIINRDINHWMQRFSKAPNMLSTDYTSQNNNI